MKYLISIILLVGIFSILPLAIAQSSGVPDWVKNNAQWWAEGKISEKEYLAAIKFLVDNQIIHIETVQRYAKSLGAEEHDRLLEVAREQGYVSQSDNYIDAIKVRFSSGDLTEEISLDTFARFNSGKDKTYLTSLRDSGYASYFLLESLPSKDKADFYKLISMYINPGKKPQPFDVSISGIMNDGTPLLTTNYKKCQAVEYSIYTQDLAVSYQYSNELKEEIRDHVKFSCGGPSVGEITSTFPVTEFIPEESLENNSPKGTGGGYYIIPNENDRAMSYVVHFFNGELDEIRSFDTFKVFSPSINKRESAHVTITEPANPFDSSPQFYLESLPTKDKKGFYDFLSRYINPGKIPEQFNVSVDLISGDGTILQRWNYAKCNVIDYTIHLEEYTVRFTFTGEKASEILEKTDFKCSGLNLKVQGYDTINEIPVASVSFDQKSTQESLAGSSIKQADRAMSFKLQSFGGELEETFTYTNFPKFESLSWERPQVPANHPKEFEFGFFVESNPSVDKAELYQDFARYINPGKAPEPFNVNVDVITGDGTVLHTLKYSKCSAIDLDWYLQDFVFFPALSNIPSPETRERYTHYCTGFWVEVP